MLGPALRAIGRTLDKDPAAAATCPRNVPLTDDQQRATGRRPAKRVFGPDQAEPIRPLRRLPFDCCITCQ